MRSEPKAIKDFFIKSLIIDFDNWCAISVFCYNKAKFFSFDDYQAVILMIFALKISLAYWLINK
tara:strand:+ start:681 stop:872 length:192 start_codon:yes stop_codon:yes gene_type:complete